MDCSYELAARCPARWPPLAQQGSLTRPSPHPIRAELRCLLGFWPESPHFLSLSRMHATALSIQNNVKTGAETLGILALIPRICCWHTQWGVGSGSARASNVSSHTDRAWWWNVPSLSIKLPRQRHDFSGNQLGDTPKVIYHHCYQHRYQHATNTGQNTI